jgi:hypothetical protein
MRSVEECQCSGNFEFAVRERNSSLTRESFFRAFPMKVDAMRTRVDRALAGMGF